VNRIEINDALDQVRQLQSICLTKQKFYGYSGKARLFSGVFALLVALVLHLRFHGASELTHFKAWGILAVVSIVTNYLALLLWFLYDDDVQREPRRLRPAIEALPPFAIAGVLTMAFFLNQSWMYMVGTWMLCFGLMNLASRNFLERAIGWVGLYYVVAGTFLILAPTVPFTNPWPMGIIFFAGEVIGGLIMWKGKPRERR